jgi:hypothetical protein
VLFYQQIAKLEELQDLQSKRRKEAEKTRKIQMERTSLAIRMREEDRLWQKSRRAFRVWVPHHDPVAFIPKLIWV